MESGLKDVSSLIDITLPLWVDELRNDRDEYNREKKGWEASGKDKRGQTILRERAEHILDGEKRLKTVLDFVYEFDECVTMILNQDMDQFMKLYDRYKKVRDHRDSLRVSGMVQVPVEGAGGK